jgi:hypothetical protein
MPNVIKATECQTTERRMTERQMTECRMRQNAECQIQLKFKEIAGILKIIVPTLPYLT